MSAALFRIRLYFNGRVGIAKHDGVSVDLSVMPQILPLWMDEIDYAPEVHVAQCREHGEQTRDMTVSERAAVRSFLERLSSSARAIVNNPGVGGG